MADLPNVAIACQGGGSHAAFCAGVLQRLFGADLRDRFRLVGLSGTSGGAMCAAAAWAGWHLGGPDEASRRLQSFWDGIKAETPVDKALNFWGQWVAHWPVSFDISPYRIEPVAEQRLGELIDTHIRPDEVPAPRDAEPRLLIGATDVLSGERVVFTGAVVATRHLLASAAVPPLFRAVDFDGHVYWDGVYTSNPPVREFTQLLARTPDEIWVVQVNPQRRRSEPTTIGDILDRRNELGGNLALAQELAFIAKITELVERYPVLADRYRPIRVRLVTLPFAELDEPSKFDRSPELIDRLIEAGRTLAERFLVDAAWPAAPGSAAAEAPGRLPMRSRVVGGLTPASA